MPKFLQYLAYLQSLVMPKFDDQLETIYASDRKELREWLKKNHCVA